MAKLLILEDDAEQAVLLRDALRRRGHDVEWKGTGSEALSRLAAGDIDLLIADLIIYKDGELTADGGLSLLGHIQQAAKHHQEDWALNLKVLAISGTVTRPGMSSILTNAKVLGAHDSLPKPIELPTLYARVDQLLSETVEAAASSTTD